MLMTKFFDFTESTIEISAFYLAQNFTANHREILFDIFAKKYNNQQILIDCSDGEAEHLRYNGFWNFLELLINEFSIPHSQVSISTADKNFYSQFPHHTLRLNVFASVHEWLKDSCNYLPGPDFDKPLDSDARLLACTVGRFSIPRLRLMYELDQNFSSDQLLLMYSQSCQQTIEQLKFLKCDEQYQEELDWLYNRKFDQDDPDISDINTDKYTNADGWQRWVMRYHKLWPRYHIDVISESDIFAPYWFTEKTSRCLATGKPFVLISAPNSLARLQDMGFVTFGDIIDENYDRETSLTKRIATVFQTLQTLNQSCQRTQLLERLHSRAKQNIKIFAMYCQNRPIGRR